MRSRAARPWLAGGLARVALLPPAALAVHQLRYALAYGGAAGGELERQGHSYLHSAVPWLVLAVALVAGAFLRALARALSGRRSPGRRRMSFAVLWLVCALALVAIYCCQETLEGLLASGHPGGLQGIFGGGGWWSVPAAVAVGLVLATVLRGARWALDAVARGLPRALARGAAPRTPLPRVIFLASPAPVVAGWSDRGPPR